MECYADGSTMSSDARRRRGEPAGDRLPRVVAHRRRDHLAPGADALARVDDAGRMPAQLPGSQGALARSDAASRPRSGLGLRVRHLRAVHTATAKGPRATRTRTRRRRPLGPHRGPPAGHAGGVRPHRRPRASRLAARAPRRAGADSRATRRRGRSDSRPRSGGACSRPTAGSCADPGSGFRKRRTGRALPSRSPRPPMRARLRRLSGGRPGSQPMMTGIQREGE